MTSFLKLPFPPAGVARDVVLYLTGMADNHAGDAVYEKQINHVFSDSGWLVLAVSTGKGKVTAGSQIYTVKQGDLLIVPLDKKLGYTSELCFSCALLGGDLTQRYLTAVTERLGVQFHINLHSSVAGMLRRIYNSIELGAAVDGYWGCEKAFALLMEISALADKEESIKIPLLVDQAVELIRTQYAYLSGIEELADRLGVSKHHLIREFSEYIGTPPGRYLSEVRLENAKLLLQTGKYTLEMVADMVGFAGANYFCKVFKKAFSMTPTEYAQSTAHRRPNSDVDKLEQMFYL